MRQILLSLFLTSMLIATAVFAASDEGEQLFQAVEQKNLSRVSTLLDSGVSPDLRNPKALIAFQTPLSLAVSSADTAMVTLLLSHGADIDKRVGFWHNISPLYLAVKNGNLELTRLLVEAGARINPNRWTKVKEFLIAPINLFRGDVVDLNQPPSLLDAARQSGNDELLVFLKQRGAR